MNFGQRQENFSLSGDLLENAAAGRKLLGFVVLIFYGLLKCVFFSFRTFLWPFRGKPPWTYKKC